MPVVKWNTFNSPALMLQIVCDEPAAAGLELQDLGCVQICNCHECHDMAAYCTTSVLVGLINGLSAAFQELSSGVTLMLACAVGSSSTLSRMAMGSSSKPHSE